MLSPAAGSVTRTVAPCNCNCAATFNAGESRMSSESGLNAAPNTATRFPSNDPSHTSRANSTIRIRRRMLMASTSRKNVSA